MTESTHISQEDLALYAMQALPAEEQASAHAHLDACAGCKAQLAQIAGELALAAMSVPSQPLPEGARSRFLARIGHAPAADSSQTSTKVATISGRRSMQPARGSSINWIPWGLVAALLMLCVGLGAQLVSISRQLGLQRSLVAAQTGQIDRAQKVLEVLSAPASQHVLLTAGAPHPAPSARAIYLASRGSLVLEASNLAPVAAGKTYELWIIPLSGAAPVPAGLFHPDPAGSASVVLPSIPSGIQAKAFGVTVENAGGASTPTLPIVLSGAATPSGD